MAAMPAMHTHAVSGRRRGVDGAQCGKGWKHGSGVAAGRAQAPPKVALASTRRGAQRVDAHGMSTRMRRDSTSAAPRVTAGTACAEAAVRLAGRPRRA